MTIRTYHHAETVQKSLSLPLNTALAEPTSTRYSFEPGADGDLSHVVEEMWRSND
jgi:hypothetical protein